MKWREKRMAGWDLHVNKRRLGIKRIFTALRSAETERDGLCRRCRTATRQLSSLNANCRSGTSANLFMAVLEVPHSVNGRISKSLQTWQTSSLPFHLPIYSSHRSGGNRTLRNKKAASKRRIHRERGIERVTISAFIWKSLRRIHNRWACLNETLQNFLKNLMPLEYIYFYSWLCIRMEFIYLRLHVFFFFPRSWKMDSGTENLFWVFGWTGSSFKWKVFLPLCDYISTRIFGGQDMGWPVA